MGTRNLPHFPRDYFLFHFLSISLRERLSALLILVGVIVEKFKLSGSTPATRRGAVLYT